MINMFWSFLRWYKSIKIERLEIKNKAFEDKLTDYITGVKKYKTIVHGYPHWYDIYEAKDHSFNMQQIPKLRKRISACESKIRRIKN